VFLVAFSSLIALGIGLAMFKSAAAAPGGPSTRTVLAGESHSTTQGLGYWLVASDGGIFGEGGATFDGTTGGLALNDPIVGMAATPNGSGYWLVASDGGIFSYGNAAFEGSAGGVPLHKPIVGMAATPDGSGYWLVASDGGIFSYGDAQFYGSAGGLRLDEPIVGMAATPDGKGYWLVASDGGIFSYGDAQFYGSTGGTPINKPIVGMASSPDGKGYWLVASDGGIFNYGDTAFYGSTGGARINRPIVGMASSPDGKGYWLVASDGGIFNYGDAAFDGSAGAMPLNKPIVGMALSGVFSPASKLVFSTEPGGASGGTPFATQPVVTVEDAAGAPVTTDSSTVTIGPASGSGGAPETLNGCASTGDKNGVFTFNGCTIDTAGGGYQLVASDGQLAAATSAPFTVRTGPATHIDFTTEPGNAIGGSAFVTQPTVTIEDAGGNTVTTDTDAIALAIQSGPGGTLAGCSATNTSGVVSFTGCSVNTEGTYTLSAIDASDTLTAKSSSFDVGSGVASQLVFTSEPAGAAGGTAFSTQPTVTIEDAGGNTVTSDTSAITLARTAGAGTLSGCTSTTTGGVASFSGCSITTAGSGDVLTATDASDALSAQSAAFAVVAGSAHQLVFTTEPAGATGGRAFGSQPTVTIEDTGGNTVTTDTDAITLAFTTGSGTLSGCTATTSAGVAAFSGCTINASGTGDILTANDAGDTLTRSSAPFAVTVGLPAQLVFTTEPAGATGGTAFGTQPTVTIEDAGGNTVTSDTEGVTLALTTGSGTLSGCTSTTTAGVAAFSGCTIDVANTGDVLTASDTGDTLSAPSGTFAVTVGAPAQLVFTTQPGDAVAGSPFGIQPVVTIEDAGGNTVTTDPDPITMAMGSGPGVLSNCTSTTTGGIATFSGCSINDGGEHLISATDGTEALDMFSAQFDVTP